jgi:hypothetical protein
MHVTLVKESQIKCLFENSSLFSKFLLVMLMLMLIKVCVSETRLTDYKRERLGGKDKFKKCVLSRRRN